MRRILPLLFIWCFNSISHAETLDFEQPTTVTAAAKGVYLHLDSSGRRALAISAEVVAVVWEDNRSGKPAIYTAYLIPGKTRFSAPQKISGQSPAYEPVIAALSGQRFLVGWEEDEQTWLRVVGPVKKGTAIKIGDVKSKQISVATSDARKIDAAKIDAAKIAAVWSQGQKQQFYIYDADLNVDDYTIQPSSPRLVDTSEDKDMQLYPVIEFSRQGRVVVWEDRREGATRIFTAFAPDSQPFQPYRLLNEFSPPPNPKLSKGTGAMRPVLASDNKQLVVAAWMDKRNWRSGYDVYAAVSINGGKDFGENEQAQDLFAENIPQWHASVTVREQDGVAAVAWDDTRNENPDVFYSLRIKGEWSDDYELPGASGPGSQTHPAIRFDKMGVLHAVWLRTVNGQSSLQYARSGR